MVKALKIASVSEILVILVKIIPFPETYYHEGGILQE